MIKEIKKILFYDPAAGYGRRYLFFHWLVNTLFLLVWCLGLSAVCLYFGKVNYNRQLFFSYFARADLFWLNTLPVIALALALFLIFNRVWPAVLGSGVLCLVVALIGHFKLLFRNDPLLATDIAYFAEAAQISSRYNVRITPLMILCFVTVAAASVFAFFFMKAKVRRLGRRGIGALVLVTLCVWLYRDYYTSYRVYNATGNLDIEFTDGYRMNRYNDTDQYCSRGGFYPLIYSTVRRQEAAPAGYTAAEARELLEAYPEADIPSERKVNVISIMLEAYNDFSLYGEELFPFETDPYAFFHELQSESLHGTLVTNIFAGGTIDTERCYITGSSKMYEYRNSAWSFARYFNDQGYFTEFCHPGFGWFYNRQNVMEYLGFQRCWFYENRYDWLPRDWGIMGDDEFFPDLLKLLDEASAQGKPYFNFSVTYQNHGPYSAVEYYDQEREYIPQGELSDETHHILNNYFWGIRRTDEQLRILVEALRQREEPIVFVIFGDHKPWLGDNNSVYSELGIDLSRTTEESFYHYYCTQYTIWANDAARAVLGDGFTGEGPSLSPGFLMMELFDRCGWEGPAFLQAVRELYADIDVVNLSGRYRLRDGTLTDALPPEPRETLDRFLRMQHYLMLDWRKGNG